MFTVLSVVGTELSKLIMVNNIICNYSNILLDNTEYDEQINLSLIRPSIETPLVTEPQTSILNKILSLENIENYIDEKYDGAAMSHLKQQIL